MRSLLPKGDVFPAYVLAWEWYSALVRRVAPFLDTHNLVCTAYEDAGQTSTAGSFSH